MIPNTQITTGESEGHFELEIGPPLPPLPPDSDSTDLLTVVPRLQVGPDGLTSPQRLVLQLLRQGNTVESAAFKADVHRSTLYRWQKNSAFATAFEKWKQETRDLGQASLLSMTRDAIHRVHQAILKGDPRIALQVLRHTGLLCDPQKIKPLPNVIIETIPPQAPKEEPAPTPIAPANPASADPMQASPTVHEMAPAKSPTIEAPPASAPAEVPQACASSSAQSAAPPVPPASSAVPTTPAPSAGAARSTHPKAAPPAPSKHRDPTSISSTLAKATLPELRKLMAELEEKYSDLLPGPHKNPNWGKGNPPGTPGATRIKGN